MPERGEALSERELEVLRLAATGASNDQIARQLVISSNTVKVHLRNIFAKLGVASRTEASLYAIRQGWVAVPPTAAEEKEEPEVAVEEPVVESPPPTGKPQWRRILAIGGLSTALLLAIILNLTGVIPPNWFHLRPTPTSGPTVRQWTAHSEMLTPRNNLTLVFFRDSLYAVGGENAQGVSSIIERFDPISNTWTALAPKPTAVADIQGAVLDGDIYIPGGRGANGQPTAVTEVYLVEQNQWTSTTKLPYAVSGYALVASEGRLYLFGGWDGTRYRDEILGYDPTSKLWTTVGRLPFPLGFAGAVAVSGRILVVGGVDGSGPVDKMMEYPSRPDQLLNEPQPVPTSLGRAQAVVFGDYYLYVLAESSDTALPKLWKHHLRTTQWTVVETGPGGAYSGAAIASMENEVFIAGGKDGQVSIPSFWSYKAFYQVSP